jgi:ABC-type ATPase with predicted acetyltransferase domain
MRIHDPATDHTGEVRTYECPQCGGRVEARGSCCCPDCECEMVNLSKPRHR